MAWKLVGVSNTVEVTGTAHALVTTGISGLQEGDLLVACITSRIASTTSITLPSGWALVGEQKNNNVLTTTGGQASALMAYIVRGASDPALTFTHPTAPSVAVGRIIAYRNPNAISVAFDVSNAVTSGTNVTAINVAAGVTTTQANDLLVVLRAGGQESTISGLAAATAPTTASGATDTTTDPIFNAWTERSDAITTTGADTALSIFDAVKGSTTATGNITATASAGSGHSLVTGAFKTVLPTPVTISGISVDVACVGPFKASNGAYYFFGVDGTTATTLQAYKSTDPATSWSSIDTLTGFTTAIAYISGFQLGNVFHLVLTDGTSGTAYTKKYITFDASTDTFVLNETLVTAENTQDSGTDLPYAGIVVRSTNEVVVGYNSAQNGTDGVMSYKRRTGVNTWSSAVAVNSAGAQRARVVLGLSNRLHFIFHVTSIGADTFQRHLTSANVLGTQAANIDAATVDVATWTDGGAVKHVGLASTDTFAWTSADNPTMTLAAPTLGVPLRGAVDNNIVYALYRDSSSDLVVRTSSDSGATWGAAADLALTGTVVSAEVNLSRDQTSYTRAGKYVFPYIANDNGTLKYSEYILRGGAPADYVDTIEAGALPIGGQALAADRHARSDTITSSALPIGGQALAADRFARSDTIVAGALPIGGQALAADIFARSDTITASSVPIAGQDVVPDYVPGTGNVEYGDTIEPGAVPITGQDVAPVYTANYADTITPSSVPIGGATLAPVYAISEVITAGALPINGATITGLRAFSDTLTAGTLPIVGAALVDLLAFSDTIAASAIPIAGQNVTPLFSAGGINYTDTIEASAVPIVGQAITPVHVAHYTDTITPSTLPIGGAVLIDAYGRTVTITPSAVPIGGAVLTDAYGRTDTITAGALPITGAVLVDVYASTDVIVAGSIPITGATISPVSAVSDTITPSAVPLVGQTISPTFTRAFSDTIAPGSVPIIGAAIVPFYTARYSDVIVAGSLPLIGQNIVPVSTAGADYTVTIEIGSVPITGSTLNPVYNPANPASNPIQVWTGTTYTRKRWDEYRAEQRAIIEAERVARELELARKHQEFVERHAKTERERQAARAKAHAARIAELQAVRQLAAAEANASAMHGMQMLRQIMTSSQLASRAADTAQRERQAQLLADDDEEAVRWLLDAE